MIVQSHNNNLTLQSCFNNIQESLSVSGQLRSISSPWVQVPSASAGQQSSGQ